MITRTPQPPYYAVIFTSKLTENDQGYKEMAKAMEIEVAKESGFIGFESARDTIGITISYWQDLASIEAWKNNANHLRAKDLGKKQWYEHYKVRIAKVEKEYSS